MSVTLIDYYHYLKQNGYIVECRQSFPLDYRGDRHTLRLDVPFNNLRAMRHPRDPANLFEREGAGVSLPITIRGRIHSMGFMRPRHQQHIARIGQGTNHYFLRPHIGVDVDFVYYEMVFLHGVLRANNFNDRVLEVQRETYGAYRQYFDFNIWLGTANDMTGLREFMGL